MAHNIDNLLSEFKATDYAVRFSAQVTNILPFAESIPHAGSIEQAAMAISPQHASQLAGRARELAAGPGPQSVLNTATWLDRGDKGIALYSGVRTLFKMFRRSSDAMETDPQQMADAGLKAVGLSWMAWKLYPGSPAEKAQALWGSRAGNSLMGYYVAVDVALPFADNVMSQGGAFFQNVVNKAAVQNAGRLGAMGDSNQALLFLRTITGRLSELTASAAQYIQPITQKAASTLPRVAAGADAVAGVMATAADSLDVYRYMATHMVLEECLRQARAEMGV